MLAGALSFPGHPKDIERPDMRDPMTAIGYIGDTVTVETDPVTGAKSFWSEYHPAQSRPEVGAYLDEFAAKLGLSIFSDSDGHEDPETEKWVAESLVPNDPYRSVDLVVAPGRDGRFERVAEGLRRIQEASATAEEKKETHMEIKEVNDNVVALTKIVEGLVAIVEGKAKAELTVEADATAVKTAVESRLADYDKAVGLISEAKLTESQAESLRALAKDGVDITTHVETAKKVLAEARAAASGEDTEAHLGGAPASKLSFDVPGFGTVVN